jgi:hypothetical protein
MSYLRMTTSKRLVMEYRREWQKGGRSQENVNLDQREMKPYQIVSAGNGHRILVGIPKTKVTIGSFFTIAEANKWLTNYLGLPAARDCEQKSEDHR